MCSARACRWPMSTIWSHKTRQLTPYLLAKDILMKTVRSLIEDGLLVVGGIVGGSDERVEPWDMSIQDAMARIHEEYVVHYDDQNWVFGTWFALTDSGKQVAKSGIGSDN